jgi:transcriptional regulator with XRE-family HTH domain
MPTIHARIRRRRQALNLSQEQLAEVLNVTRQTVQQWETEPGPPGSKVLSTAPKRTRLADVARVLGVTEEWLVTGRDPEGRLQDPGKDQLDRFYEGMTPEMRHILIAQANTLYNLSNPGRPPDSADPYPGKSPPPKDRKP